MAAQTWLDPDVSYTWEISEIAVPAVFMSFIFKHAPAGSEWVLRGVTDRAARAALEPMALEPGPAGSSHEIRVPLTGRNVAHLEPLLARFDFYHDFSHQFVCDTTDCLLVAYDNLARCWVSKAIPESTMRAAAVMYGFKYHDAGG